MWILMQDEQLLFVTLLLVNSLELYLKSGKFAHNKVKKRV